MFNAEANARIAETAGPIAVALSGGADSVCLLHMLLKAYPGRTGDIVALHFNHHMRGDAADKDERFCADLCKGLGVQLHVGHATSTLKTEDEAREARFSFFDSVQQSLGFKILLTGHHLNDVAETMLLRLLRSAGTSGLAAPRPVQEGGRAFVCARPLLDLKKEQITQYLSRNSLAWREDATNAANDHLRNRMRNIVLPTLSKCTDRDVVSAFGSCRELLQEDDDALAVWAAQATKTDAAGLDLAPILSTPTAVQRRVVLGWTTVNNLRLSKASVDALLKNLGRTYFRHSCGNGLLVVRKKHLSYVP